jgi:hypothetical protein
MATDLLQTIREKQEQILQLQRELDEARQLLNGTPSASMPSAGSGVSRQRGAGGNSVIWAQDVLRDANRPLHVNEIIQLIARKHRVNVKYATLVSNLVRLVSADKIFQRMGPNIFGLKGWPMPGVADDLLAG